MNCDWCDKDATFEAEVKPMRKVTDVRGEGVLALPVKAYACAGCWRRIGIRYGVQFAPLKKVAP